MCTRAHPVRGTAVTQYQQEEKTRRTARSSTRRPRRHAALARRHSQDLGEAHGLLLGIWERQREQLISQSYRLMGHNHADAEDALSTAMLRLLELLPSYGTRVDNESAWLYRFVHNVCMDQHRVAQRHSRFMVHLDGDPDDLHPNAPSSSSPEELLLEQEFLEQLRAHVIGLPPNLREPFIMRFRDGRSYDDIALALGLTNCNVRKRIQLAYARLRAAFTDPPDD